MSPIVQNAIRTATALAATIVAQGAGAGNLQHYAHVGAYNAVTYSFTAQSTGDVKAYFSGALAAYESQVGLLVDGVSTGVFGLDNQTSKVGQSLDFGQVKAGQTLTFVLKILTLGGKQLYSSRAMNAADDASVAGGANHIFSSAYDGADPSLPGVPAGTFVGFEDQKASHSDFDYNDESFVFTNVATALNAPPGATASTAPAPLPPGKTPPRGLPPATQPSAVPEPATWALMLIGFGGLGVPLRRRRLARTAAAVV